jgi:hypothetical protein
MNDAEMRRIMAKYLEDPIALLKAMRKYLPFVKANERCTDFAIDTYKKPAPVRTPYAPKDDLSSEEIYERFWSCTKHNRHRGYSDLGRLLSCSCLIDAKRLGRNPASEAVQNRCDSIARKAQ